MIQDDKLKVVSEPSPKYQLITTFIVCLLIFGYSIFESWNETNSLLFTSNNTPLSFGKITMDQMSWVTSLESAGIVVGALGFGYITNVVGRKPPLLVIGILISFSTLLIWYAQSVWFLYAARTLGGLFGGGAYTIAAQFLSEIAFDNIRGALVSSIIFALNGGRLVAYMFGTYFEFWALPAFTMTTLITFIVLFYLVPESPFVLMKQNKIHEAEMSLRFYQNIRNTEKDRLWLETEMNKIKWIVDENQNQNGSSMGFSLRLSHFTTKTARKAFAIGIVLVILSTCTGPSTIFMYATLVFKETGSSLPPNVSTIVLSVVNLIGVLMALFLVDRIGRKILIISSGIGIFCGVILIGIYMHLKSAGIAIETSLNWIPLVDYSLMTFIFASGLSSLPIAIIAEIFPEQIKSFGISFGFALTWTFIFINSKCFLQLIDAITFHGAMYMYATICLFGLCFIAAYLPETKRKSHDEIMKSLE